MRPERLAEDWARVLAARPVRRMAYEYILREVLARGYVHTEDIARDVFHSGRHSAVRQARRYTKELVDKGILQKRRNGASGKWYYEPTDWWRALLIETYKALKRI